MATVRADFFLDPRDRLTEQERALMTGMLADLLAGIADEIRAELPSKWAAANDEDGHRLVRQLAAAGLLGSDELVSLLLRRADEERINAAAKARSRGGPSFLQALIGDTNEAVAGASMRLILARGRRRDRLGQPRVELADLDPETAAILVHSVAATMRQGLGAVGRAGDADSVLAAAASKVLGDCDRSKRLEAITVELARALIASDRLQADLLELAAHEGDVAFLAVALAERAGIGAETAWECVLDREERGFALLLRMADITRDTSARLLAAFAEFVGGSDPAEQIARFDAIDDEEADAMRRWLRLDGGYREAVKAIGDARG